MESSPAPGPPAGIVHKRGQAKFVAQRGTIVHAGPAKGRGKSRRLIHIKVPTHSSFQDSIWKRVPSEIA